MGKLTVFNHVSLNGFFKGPDGDISWHRHGVEEGEYAAEMLALRNTLLFGRVTYQLMASYWPTPFAIEDEPIVAERMNSADKVVFSTTLDKAEWQNTRIVKDDIVGEVRRMKQRPGSDMALLGSGSLVTQFANEGLIDEYQIMVDPVVLGAGTPLFNNITRTLDLTLTRTRTFRSGVVLLHYEPHEPV